MFRMTLLRKNKHVTKVKEKMTTPTRVVIGYILLTNIGVDLKFIKAS